jgi:hypothetical protein
MKDEWATSFSALIFDFSLLWLLVFGLGEPGRPRPR